MHQDAPLLSIHNMSKHRPQGDGYMLHIEHFSVQRGDLLALVGPSGCGKSTALDLMAAILQPEMLDETSHFFFEDVNMLKYWQHDKKNALAKIRQKHMGYVLQTGGLLPFLSGRDNICVACPNVNAAELDELTHMLDIKHLLNKKPAQMSVGERQRFAIARALVHNPDLILADEPVASLDPLNARKVMDLFVTLTRQRNSTVVMVSHAPNTAQAAGFTLVPLEVSRDDEADKAHIVARLHHQCTSTTPQQEGA